jgi:hypothetical protein
MDVIHFQKIITALFFPSRQVGSVFYLEARIYFFSSLLSWAFSHNGNNCNDFCRKNIPFFRPDQNLGALEEAVFSADITWEGPAKAGDS